MTRKVIPDNVLGRDNKTTYIACKVLKKTNACSTEKHAHKIITSLHL